MLSPFINRRKVKKISLFDAALRRAPSSPPLEIQSDQENPRSRQWVSPSAVATSPRSSALRRQSSPKVHLDFTPSGSNDRFPQEILVPQDDHHFPIQPTPRRSTSSTYDDVVVIGPERPPPKSKPSPALPPLPVDDGPSPIEPEHDATTLPLSRKPAPAPIKIPSEAQVQRSASTSHSGLKETSALFPTTNHEPSNTLQSGTAHPSSAVSLNDDSSAVSGTTLAQALIANSFILSNDNPGRNRYKSGDNLARQDSATLPGANENGLLISPYWRDMRISGGDIVRSPDSGVDSHIPPIPPIPPSLSSAMSHPHHMSTEGPRKPLSRSQSLRIDYLYNRPSKKSEPPSLTSVTAGPSDNSTPAPTQVPVSGGNPRLSLPQPPSDRSTSSHDNSSNYSLSNPSSPPRNANLNATSPDPAPVNIRRSQLPPSLNLSSPSAVTDDEDSSRFRPTPSDTQDEPQRTSASSNTTQTERTVGSATSGEDTTEVLTAYRLVSPLKSSSPVHLRVSPDPSTPSLSPWSGGSRSHRTNAGSSMSFPQTPNSATGPSRSGVSVLDTRRVFADSNVPGQRQSGPSRSGLLPVGNDRPRSLQSPSSPFLCKSNESRRSMDDANPAASNPQSSGISSPDILDFMFIPSAPSSPSRPHPIKVIRKSLDSFEGAQDRSPATVETLCQTFPETPQAFNPLFSTSIGIPGVPPLPSSSVGTPGMPLSAAHKIGRLRRGISNPAIGRAASLSTRKTPSNSNRTRMSPISSAPGTPRSPEVRKANGARKSSRFETQQLQAATNLLTPSLSAPGEVSLPVPPSPRRNSDPTGRVSSDLETLVGRVELLEEVSRSTPEVKEPEAEPSEDTPFQRSTLAPLEKSPGPSIRGLSAAEGEGQLSTPDPRDKDGGSVSVSSTLRNSARGSTPSNNQVRRFSLKRRPQLLDLPVVSSYDELTASSGPITGQADGSSGIHRSAGPSSQTDATPKTGVFQIISADTTTPVATPPRFSSAASIRSSNTSGLLSPPVNVFPPPDLSLSHPSTNPSSHATHNAPATSPPVPPSQKSPTRSPSSLNPTPTSPISQVQSASPALSTSALVSPAQYYRPNSLDVLSFESFLHQSYTDLVAVHPPPSYQTAILSQAVSVNGENELPAGSGLSLPSHIHAPTNRQGDGPRPAQPTQLPPARAQRIVTNVAPVSEVRGRSDSVSDTRIPRSRPLGPRKPSGSQRLNMGSSLGSHEARQDSVSSLRPGVGFGMPPTSRKLSTANIRGRSGPRFPTVPVKWRGCTLDVARWTFTPQQLQEISSRAINASAESYYVRLLELETLDTELPEELHRLELLTTELKTRTRAAAAARGELLEALTAHASGTGPLDRHNLERVVEELDEATQLGEELNDELYTVADQIAQLKRLMDVHSSSALAMSLRNLNANFLRQTAGKQFLRERVAALEAERDIAWVQAENIAQEFDDLSTKLEQGVTSTPSSTNNNRRASRVSAVRKSGNRAPKSGLRLSMVGKPIARTSKRSSSVSPFTQPSEDIPPLPPIPDIHDLGSDINQPPRHRPPFIQMVNLPDQVTPGGLYSEMTPNTETRAMAQAQRELCEMLGISLTDVNSLKSRPRSVSEFSLPDRPSAGFVRRNSDVKPLIPKRHGQ